MKFSITDVNVTTNCNIDFNVSIDSQYHHFKINCWASMNMSLQSTCRLTCVEHNIGTVKIFNYE